MHGPEETDFALRGGTHGAVRVPKETGLVVLRHPSFTRERSWPIRLELRRAFHGKGTHLTEPRCECGQEARWRGLPNARTVPGYVRHIGLQAVSGTFGDQRGR